MLYKISGGNALPCSVIDRVFFLPANQRKDLVFFQRVFVVDENVKIQH